MLETVRAFNALSEEFVEVSLRKHPVDATRAGIHDYDSLLPDDSPEGFQDRATWLRSMEQRLVASVPWGELPTGQRVDYALMRSAIAAARADLEEIHAPARDPVRYPETAMTGVFLLVTRAFAPLEERKEAILARLMGIPDYLEAAQANLRQVPGLFVRIALEVNGCGPEIVRGLLRSFPGEAERIEHAGDRARAGFFRYQTFLEQDLSRRAGGEIAIGERWMNYKLEREHLLSMDCVQLEAFGREHVERTREALEQEARRLDPSRSWRALVDEARARHPEARRLREAYAAEVERARRFVAEKRLAPLPEAGIEVVDTPLFERPTLPYAAYLPPAPFDEEQTGLFYVTPVDLNRPREEQEQRLQGHCYASLPLTVVHESFPGHHLQLCHAHRAGSRLRRLASSDLLAEGWALYCEELMVAQGFGLDPATRLFQLKDQLWRACRVLVDVGLQSGRMTFEQAVDLLVDQAMIERANAEAEVKRYALTPTQPLSYLVGKQQLLEIRGEAERRLGRAFDLHDFHAEVLSLGTIPPFLVRQELSERLAPR
jgi:uncharacterized protein (DUF885 family)